MHQLETYFGIKSLVLEKSRATILLIVFAHLMSDHIKYPQCSPPYSKAVIEYRYQKTMSTLENLHCTLTLSSGALRHRLVLFKSFQ